MLVCTVPNCTEYALNTAFKKCPEHGVQMKDPNPNRKRTIFYASPQTGSDANTGLSFAMRAGGNCKHGY